MKLQKVLTIKICDDFVSFLVYIFGVLASPFVLVWIVVFYGKEALSRLKKKEVTND